MCTIQNTVVPLTHQPQKLTKQCNPKGNQGVTFPCVVFYFWEYQAHLASKPQKTSRFNRVVSNLTSYTCPSFFHCEKSGTLERVLEVLWTLIWTWLGQFHAALTTSWIHCDCNSGQIEDGKTFPDCQESPVYEAEDSFLIVQKVLKRKLVGSKFHQTECLQNICGGHCAFACTQYTE